MTFEFDKEEIFISLKHNDCRVDNDNNRILYIPFYTFLKSGQKLDLIGTVDIDAFTFKLKGDDDNP